MFALRNPKFPPFSPHQKGTKVQAFLKNSITVEEFHVDIFSSFNYSQAYQNFLQPVYDECFNLKLPQTLVDKIVSAQVENLVFLKI